MFKKYLYRRQLKKAREEAQLIFDHAAKKRENHPDGIYRDIVDFMTTRERRVYHEIMREEWSLSKLVGEQPQWGSARMLYVDVDDGATPAATNVKYNRSKKAEFKYFEDLDMWAMTFGGVISSAKYHWLTPEQMNHMWSYDEAFHIANDEWHAAETDEEKQAVVDKFKEENPKWSL